MRSLLIAAALSWGAHYPGGANLVVPARAEPAGAGSTSRAGEQITPAAPFRADAALSAGMKAIRDATLDVHTLVTHRRMPPDMASRYADTVKRHAETMRAAPQREAGAAAEVNALLDEIVRGAEAVAGRGGELDPIDGIITVDEALSAYGERFADETWKPLR